VAGGGVTEAEFQETLLRILDRKHHSAWPRWTGPGITPAQLRLHFQQEWGVFVRDFPRFLGLVHGHCPVPEVRRALAANLYEEETGKLSFGRPHPELFLDLMQALGFERAAFEDARLLPEAAAYRACLDAAIDGPWVVGAAVVTIWVEGSVHERRALAGEPEEPVETKLRNHFLVRHHGLKPEQLMLMRAHAAVEGGHRQDAWQTTLRNASDDATRRAVIQTMERACTLWHGYRDAVTRAAGLAA
jgi:pyrroloquinoline-quinone synthase